jgi:tRNA(adenine34) deaminase
MHTHHDKSEREWMRRALEEARRGAERGEVPIGAVVVRAGKLVATAHNEVELRRDATAHAEVLALQRAAAALGEWRLSECSLYVTLEPCPMCIGAMLLARVQRVYFGAYDPRLGGVGSVFNLANHPALPHQIEVFPEVEGEEALKLLQEFFKARRSASLP